MRNTMKVGADYFKLTPNEQFDLDTIRSKAKIKHEKARRAAKQRGRKDYPLLPYECSWAYEMEFFRTARNK